MGFDEQVPTDVDEQVKLLNSLPALGIFILQVKPESNHFRTEDPLDNWPGVHTCWGLCRVATEPAPYLPSLSSAPSGGLNVFSLQYMRPEMTFQMIISPLWLEAARRKGGH